MTHLQSSFPSHTQLPNTVGALSTPLKPSGGLLHSPLTQAKDESPKQRSLEVLGSSLCSERKMSAFSLYNAEVMEEKDAISQEVPSFQLKLQSHSIRDPSPPTQDAGRDKREQYRLQTKNLNRFFRSKINEMLREVRESSKCEEDIKKAQQLLTKLNESNKIMFSEIREVISDEWLRGKLLSCRGLLLKYIHKGKMGMQSKLIMLKYFNKIMQAIQDPLHFTCWK